MSREATCPSRFALCNSSVRITWILLTRLLMSTPVTGSPTAGTFCSSSSCCVVAETSWTLDAVSWTLDAVSWTLNAVVSSAKFYFSGGSLHHVLTDWRGRTGLHHSFESRSRGSTLRLFQALHHKVSVSPFRFIARGSQPFSIAVSGGINFRSHEARD